ncbi:inorganic pyrophosphatase [Podospora australis]|uniref:inorganic diphosphatase n=1 Tax=Podospora australis TaxID=1536484 RepID=A0AAN7AFL4_9PEZI|nr:inorganic pyrophosphatase [Podospora australis]
MRGKRHVEQMNDVTFWKHHDSSSPLTLTSQTTPPPSCQCFPILVYVSTMESQKSEKNHEYSLRRSGRPFTKDYRVYFQRTTTTGKKSKTVPVSPWHDIPLYHDEERKIFNMVVEVPRWMNAKFEISRSKFLNPITQDLLDGEPRFTKNCFPYKGYIWNYGALPQTWESPHFKNPATKHKGDNDPIDCCCISSGPDSIAPTGSVLHVKVLGILALIDQHETDWKLLAVDTSDKSFSKLNDIDDVEKQLPGLLDATRDWFRIYKVPDGESPNKYALDGKFKDKEYAMGVIYACWEQWRDLVLGKEEAKGISIYNTTLKGTPGYLDPDDVDSQLPPDEVLPPPDDDEEDARKARLEEWFYIDRRALDDVCIDDSENDLGTGGADEIIDCILGHDSELSIALDLER